MPLITLANFPIALVDIWAKRLTGTQIASDQRVSVVRSTGPTCSLACAAVAVRSMLAPILLPFPISSRIVFEA
jgi:hypothetical protein